MPSKDAEEERVMHSNSKDIKFTSYNDANKVVDKLFDLLCSKYLGNLETSMRESDFSFDLVQLMHYKCHEVSFKHSD